MTDTNSFEHVHVIRNIGIVVTLHRFTEINGLAQLREGTVRPVNFNAVQVDAGDIITYFADQATNRRQELRGDFLGRRSEVAEIAPNTARSLIRRDANSSSDGVDLLPTQSFLVDVVVLESFMPFSNFQVRRTSIIQNPKFVWTFGAMRERTPVIVREARSQLSGSWFFEFPIPKILRPRLVCSGQFVYSSCTQLCIANLFAFAQNLSMGI